MSAAAVGEYLETHREQAVEQLKELLRIPSVSGDSAFRPQTREAGEWVQRKLADAGLETELVETAGHPIITASWLKAEGAPTVLIYGHYDVQPPDPVEKWTTPPFEPTVRDGCIYARGATDDKGQMLTHVLSVEAWLKTVGSLPVNVKFVIEGEEEVGSSNLDVFLEQHREQLAADIAVVSDTSQYAPEMPAITYGLRGIMACEVTVHGPNRDLHSGVFGGSVANPVNGLCRMIAGLHDPEGRVTIPGFYDNVIPLTDEERTAFAALPEDEAAFYAELGMTAGHGEPGFSPLERRWARPTCDVNGLYGGYTGEGPKTIVPSSATAKITCRLVPGQNPAELMPSLKAHLESMLLPGMTMEFEDQHGGQPLVFPTDSRYMQAARTAIERAFGTAPVMIREGGSIPVVATFRDVPGVDTLLLGWGQNTDNLHSPDEHFRIADFHRGTLASALLWEELAKQRRELLLQGSLMIDWPHNRELLLAESERLVQALFAENRERGDRLVAIGYVFEFGRGQLEFDMCANTAQSAEEALAELLAEDPDESPDEVRWNSGDFDYPGGVSDHYGGFSAEWRTELKRLDQFAEDDEEQSAAVHEGIANICCEVLAELATRGVIAEWSSIDFNVAALLDEIEQVKARDQQIRRLIAAAG